MQINTDKHRDPIPKDFGSEEEAAAFWDTHSLADYEDLLEPAKVKVGIERRRFEIEVEERVFRVLNQRAKTAHTTVTEMASQILRDKLAPA